MANCSQCGTNVGCGCNLITGLCISCYNKTLGDTTPTTLSKTSKGIVVYPKTVQITPTSEFTDILNTTGLSREEKLRRINEILENAKQT